MKMFEKPHDLLKAYRNGFMGFKHDPKDLDKLLGELLHPMFGATAYGLYGSGKGKMSLLYKSIQKFDPTFGPHEAQTTGDCTSHATRNAVDVTRCHEIVGGQREDFITRSATEAIYGCRGHGGEGMATSTAARFVSKIGGILLRKKYESVDLSKYNSKIGENWGRTGVPKEVIEEAKKHQVKTISLVTSVEEARDAIANGYALSVGSDYGFSSRRDKYGIAKRSGNWGHAMAWVGMDDTHEIFNETLFLIQNSWGIWNAGDKRLDQPEGSFWIRESDAAGMLAQNGSWVFSDVDGFPARKVKWSLSSVF
jgi:hypothetical protein